MSILENIERPSDLRRYNDTQLAQLCQEIRAFIIHSVSKTGGHLASNLGAVELTVALHASFEAPKDKIVWDVGHQSYTHKILTGRRDRMDTLRAKGGLSGFPRPNESAYDTFATGHASTSISAALGMARARDLLGKDFNVVAVLGDGAFGGGLVFEALNDAGSGASRLIVVLNDNDMSIAPNVGAMTRSLARMRVNPKYMGLKRWTKKKVEDRPGLESFMDRFKGTIKYAMMPGAWTFFEQLDFFYIGPVDGHNITRLKEAFSQAKKVEQQPVLVHVITQKGRGYTAAEENPSRYHGVPSFQVETGAAKKQAAPGDRTFPQSLGDALVKLAKEDRRLVAITAAMPDATGVSAFAQAFPARAFNVGIAEEHAVTMAAGMAAQGLRPVVPIYSTFLQRAYDEIIHDVCLQNLPVILGVDHAGIVGEDGETHQGIFDISYLYHIPNMTILSPASPQEMEGALRYALHLGTPVAIRYPKGGSPLVRATPAASLFDCGWERLQTGADVAILAVGTMAYQALETAKLLKAQGISCAVYSARLVKPMDEAALRAACACPLVCTLEDNMYTGGFGWAVRDKLCALGRADVALEIIAAPEAFLAHATRAQWLDMLGLVPEKLAPRIAARWKQVKA